MPLPPDDVRALDRAHVWRPYTASEVHATRHDPVIVGASGSRIRCADGSELIDATSSWWTAALGYQHPRLVEALQRQAATLSHVALAGATHAPAAELAAKLVGLAPAGTARFERVFFSDNGSTSVEVALKIAYQSFAQNGQPERTRFLSLPGAYHGDTIGAMSVGALDEFGAVFRPLLFGGEHPAAPDAPVDAAGWDGVFAGLVRTLEEEGDRICAVIVEPLVLGAAGMRMYGPALLQRLRAACDASGALLIADEVFTGLGRTGTLFAVDQAGVVPDLLCLSKALSGGMLPFGATLATAALFDAFRGDATRALMHGHTYCGNPLAAAVALETLSAYQDERVIEGLPARAEAIAACFDSLGKEVGAQAHARHLGLIGAIDLGDEGYYGTRGWAVHEAARRRGVWLRPLGDTVYVVPPLNISMPDLDQLLSVVHDCVREEHHA